MIRANIQQHHHFFMMQSENLLHLFSSSSEVKLLKTDQFTTHFSLLCLFVLKCGFCYIFICYFLAFSCTFRFYLPNMFWSFQKKGQEDKGDGSAHWESNKEFSQENSSRLWGCLEHGHRQLWDTVDNRLVAPLQWERIPHKDCDTLKGSSGSIC